MRVREAARACMRVLDFCIHERMASCLSSTMYRQLSLSPVISMAAKTGEEGDDGVNQARRPALYHRYDARQRMATTLSHYFTHVFPLLEYLARIIPGASEQGIKDLFGPRKGISTALQSRLDTLMSGLIACNVDQLPCFSQPAPWSEEREREADGLLPDLVARAQAAIMRQEGVHSRNMLTLGYRKADERSAVMSLVGDLGICNFHVNACVTQIVMGQEWRVLLAGIGEQVLEYILCNTALFTFLPGVRSSNMIQVLGHCIGDIKQLPSISDKGDTGTTSSAAGSFSVDTANGGAPQRKRRPTRRRKRQPRVCEDRESATLKDSSRGHPCTTLKRKRGEGKGHGSGYATKRIALRDGQPSVPLKSSPVQIDLLHNRIFYAKPLRFRSGNMLYGLPTSHPLNRSANKATASRKGLHTEEKADAQQKLWMLRANELTKYIWPREYGLRNVFVLPTNRRTTDYEVRSSFIQCEIEIKGKGPHRTPKRLVRARHLISIMLRKHENLDYRRALNLCCPSALPRRRLTDCERKDILDNLCEIGATQAEQSMQIETQFDAQACMYDADAGSTQVVRAEASQRPRFTKYKAPQGCVARFARLVIRQIVPIELLGSRHNLSILLKAVDRFICLRRYETMNLHEVCQGVRLSDCEWLLPRSDRALWQRPTQTETSKRRALLYELLFWLFDGLLVPLLRTNFYATESAKFRNRVLYFRHDDWSSISQPIFEKLKHECFERVAKHKAVGIMSQRDFGYSFVRLLPKEVGMRPIVNLRRRSVKIDRKASKGVPKAEANSKLGGRQDQQTREAGGGGQLVRPQQSINTILNTTFQVLNYEKYACPTDLGSSVFGPQDVHERLSRFKAGLHLKYGEKLPELYFLKMDVAGAFDCISQEKLLMIIEEIIRHDRYIVQKYTKLTSSNGQPFRQWPRLACPEGEHEPFYVLAQHLTEMQSWRNTILSDGVVNPHCDRASLIWLLREHISNNLIKVGKDFCRQRIGIPQGSTLSTLLCCYYLARMERDLDLTSAAEGAEQESLLMRYTDDFLFVSTSAEAARKFFVAVQKGSADFNCIIAPEKTRCNFSMISSDMDRSILTSAAAVQVQPAWDARASMSWCSYLIDMRTLAVRYDLERYARTCVADSLTIPASSAFGAALTNAIIQTVQRRNLPIYLDVRLNMLDGVLINVYQSFLVGILKLLSAYIALRKRFGKRPPNLRIGDRDDQTQALLLCCITESIQHCYAHACSKMSRVSRAQNSLESRKDCAHIATVAAHDRWPVSFQAYRWLALHAMHTVLRLRPSTCKWHVTRSLELQLRRTSRQTEASRPDLTYPLTAERLQQQAQVAWRDARQIVRSMTLQ